MREKLHVGMLVLVPLLLGMVLRLEFVVGASWPLNDGGMFYSMTHDLMANNFHLPTWVTYNNLHIPFAYPPLGFYVMGAIQLLTRLDLIYLFQWVPAIVSILCIVPVYFLAGEIFRDKVRVITAVTIYATLFSAYYTLVAGGGLTRAVGLFMALWSLVFWLKFSVEKKRKDWIISGIFCGLTILSHMEMAIFAVLGIGLTTIFRKLSFGSLIKVICIAALVSSPWWVTILTRFGLSPFWAGWNSNLAVKNGWKQLFFLSFTAENGVSMWAVLGFLGFLMSVWRRNYLLPVWIGLLFIILRRGPETTVSVVWSMLAAEFVVTCFEATLFKRRQALLLALIWVWMLFYVAGAIIPTSVRSREWMESVSPADREAMVWVRNNTSAEAKFVVITGLPGEAWSSNGTAEWFSVLSARESVLTIQGTEWIMSEPLKRFKENEEIYQCMKRNLECVENIDIPGVEYLYLTDNETCASSQCLEMQGLDYYVPKNFTEVYRKDGVMVWKKG